METDPELPPQTPAAPTLDYAKGPHLAWISRHRKLLIFLALCLAIGGPIYWYWEPRAYWLYWFHQATQFQMPQKSIALMIDDPAKVKLALSSNPDFISPTTFGAGNLQFAHFSPVVYRKLSQFDSRLNLTGGNDQPVAFMGTLHRPDGTPRLVIISGSRGITGNLLAFTSVLVLPIPHWIDPLPPATSSRIGRGITYSGPPPTLTRLRNGVTDPIDPSHIIFDFEAGPPGGLNVRAISATSPAAAWSISATGVIDARLQNDDSITFTLRNFTGNDPNIRITAASASMSGDLQTLQTQSLRRGGRVARGTVPPTTRVGRGGRSNGR